MLRPNGLPFRLLYGWRSDGVVDVIVNNCNRVLSLLRIEIPDLLARYGMSNLAWLVREALPHVGWVRIAAPAIFRGIA